MIRLKQNGLSAIALSVLVVSGTFAACGKTNSSSGVVTLQSGAYSSQIAARIDVPDSLSPLAVASPSPTISSFSFCVREVKLEAEDGNSIRKEGDDDDLIEMRLGLLSPNDGLKTLSWGTADIPVGTAIKKIKVQIHKDKELCGVDYSVKMNDVTLSKDIEFKFTFPKGTVMTDGKTITFDLAPIVTALQNAYAAGDFNDSGIEKHFKTDTEGNASSD